MPKHLTITLASCLLAASGAAYAGFDATAYRAAPGALIIADRTSDQNREILKALEPADEIAPRMSSIQSSIKGLSSPRASKRMQAASLKRGIGEIDALRKSMAQLQDGFRKADRLFGSDGGVGETNAFDKSLGELRDAFSSALEDLETADKLGNFEIQDLMSRFNQAETLASSVLKKKDDTASSVIGKV